ncbi:WW domain-containing protein [Pycnococcus provasolii]
MTLHPLRGGAELTVENGMPTNVRLLNPDAPEDAATLENCHHTVSDKDILQPFVQALRDPTVSVARATKTVFEAEEVEPFEHVYFGGAKIGVTTVYICYGSNQGNDGDNNASADANQQAVADEDAASRKHLEELAAELLKESDGGSTEHNFDPEIDDDDQHQVQSKGTAQSSTPSGEAEPEAATPVDAAANLLLEAAKEEERLKQEEEEAAAAAAQAAAAQPAQPESRKAPWERRSHHDHVPVAAASREDDPFGDGPMSAKLSAQELPTEGQANSEPVQREEPEQTKPATNDVEESPATADEPASQPAAAVTEETLPSPQQEEEKAPATADEPASQPAAAVTEETLPSPQQEEEKAPATADESASQPAAAVTEETQTLPPQEQQEQHEQEQEQEQPPAPEAEQQPEATNEPAPQPAAAVTEETQTPSPQEQQQQQAARARAASST